MKKIAKHSLFLLVSLFISATFLSYIIGVKEMWGWLNDPWSYHAGMFISLFIFTALFYGVFAFVREIVCTTVCPYGRLQGVLFDENTMQISYDYKRGESRGRFKKNETRTYGDCIDCRKCVLVCPTGIDIRDGVQMDCVGCTACIDACDEVMDKIGFEKGLIRYASEKQISANQPFRFTVKMKAYSAILVALLFSMSFMILTRNEVDTHITRVKGQLFQEVDESTLSNLFEAKVINKSTATFPVELKVENMNATIKLIGVTSFELKPEAINDFTFFVEVPRKEILKRNNPITIGIYRDGERIQTIKSRFLGPFQ